MLTWTKARFVSPRNTVAQNVVLLSSTDCKKFLHVTEFGSKVVELQIEIPNLMAEVVPALDHWLEAYTKPYPYFKTYKDAKWDPILVLHSSGSTGENDFARRVVLVGFRLTV